MNNLQLIKVNNNSKKISFEIFSKYRTILMGIAILFIFVFHYTEDCKINNYNFKGINSIFYTYIRSSGVDIFLFLSGFGLYYSWKKNNNYKSFLSKRFKKILIPYLLVSIPANIIFNVFIKKRSILSIFKGISFYDFLVKGDNWFWYILMILICYIIYPWIFEIVEENHTKIKSQIAMINVFTFISVISMMVQKYDPSLFEIIDIMLLRFPIFVFGSFIGRASYEKRTISLEWIAFSIITLICIPLVKTKQIVFIRYVTGAIILNIFFVLTYILKLLDDHNIKWNFVRKILEWFGLYSLELYLTHIAIRKIMNKLGFNTYRIRYFLLMLLISIILSIILKKLTNLILKKITKRVS